jgi:hypothetical protein
MTTFTGCTLELVLPKHNPNEGRDIINENFECIQNTIQFAITGATTGNTIVQAGDNIVMTGPGIGSTPPVYIVNLDDDIVLDSISASTISASTYYVGSIPLSDITSGLTYTNATATPTTIGGIAAGTTFSNKTMTEMWDSLLYPYQTPTFSAFAINGQSTSIEVGDSVPSGPTLFTWNTTNSSNVSPNTLTITDVTNFLTLGSTLADDSSESLVLPSNVTKTTATSNQWRITANNTEAGSFLINFNVNWRWRIHYGTDAATSLTAAGVTGLTSSSLSSSFAGTWSFGVGDYKYFSYPSLMGTATTFKDSSTNLDVAMEALYTVSITNAYGVSTTYNVHRTTNVLGSTINIIIS